MGSSAAFVQSKVVHKRQMRLMGNIFSISIFSEDKLWATHCIGMAVAEIQRIEHLLTTFDNTSQTNQVNDGAGKYAVKVDQEVFDLIQRSIRISDVTQGAFDISYGSIDKRLWNFDSTMTALPDQETARKMVRLINYRNIVLNEADRSVMLKNKGMRIGFGGIGKGYAADRAKKLLIDLGVSSGVVNAAGDLSVWGTLENGRPWTIGIADPNSKTPFSHFPLTNASVATSGNYEKFITIAGKRYSHTIDPKTGLPVTGIKSVTIISPFAELSDAMATPVMVMGVKAGLNMINQMKDIACIIIDDGGAVFCSSNIKLNL